MDAFVVTPGFEGALASELGPGRVPRAGTPAGLVLCDAAPDAPPAPADPVFARQVLPDAHLITAASVSRLAEAVYAAVEGAIDLFDGPFTWHAFAAGGELQPGLGSRASLVGREALELLRARRRRASRRYVDPASAAPAFAGGLIVQLAALERDALLVSVAVPRRLARGGTDIAPWPAGAAPVTIDRAPPSRAYQKLEEAFAWMGGAPSPGERCVDLGGAPGGWSYTALRRGAEVTAIDRAPLEPPAAGHPKLRMVIGNAFTYEPSAPVDWLLCDVIAEPARTLALIQRWLDERWCRALVVTIKFKGTAGYGAVDEARRALEAADCSFARIKHLRHNKNEVTVLARR